MGSRAISDVTRRDLASEWPGPEPAAPQMAVPVAREAARRVIIRKP